MIKDIINEKFDDFLYEKALPLWLLVHKIMDIPSDIYHNMRKVKWFFQRGANGYADCDFWNFSEYLDSIVVRGLTDLRDKAHGYPCMEGMDEEKWKETLSEIIDALSANEPEFGSSEEFYLDKWDAYQNRKLRARKLLVKYWGSLWD